MRRRREGRRDAEVDLRARDDDAPAVLRRAVVGRIDQRIDNTVSGRAGMQP